MFDFNYNLKKNVLFTIGQNFGNIFLAVLFKKHKITFIGFLVQFLVTGKAKISMFQVVLNNCFQKLYFFVIGVYLIKTNLYNLVEKIDKLFLVMPFNYAKLLQKKL